MFEAVSPGVVVRLQELHPGSPLLQPNQSLRIVGSLQHFDAVSGIAVLKDGDSSLHIDMQHLRNISLRVGSLFEFIGELEIQLQVLLILSSRMVPQDPWMVFFNSGGFVAVGVDA